MIRQIKLDDAESICNIYNHYVQNTTISFEQNPLSVEEMQSQIENGTKSLPWLVSEEQGGIIGYAYAGQWKSRQAYRFTVESTIYIAPNMTRRGIGYQLYNALISDLASRSLHAVIGVIALPNPASIALHEKLGSSCPFQRGRSKIRPVDRRRLLGTRPLNGVIPFISWM
ncbi:MAG: N-acetyltransferase [Anaerolineales bacterium]|nr:N-acetyltransferase [Anaerolineales bacterium]